MLDVALHAQVAVSTVSHVLNGTASIKEETRKRVLQAVEELHYTPNAMARGLRQTHTNLVGVIVPDIANQFYAECASGVLKATEAEQTVLICDSGYDVRRELAHVQTLVERRVDGLIFFGGFDDEVLKLAKNKKVPIILGDRALSGFTSVTFDNETPLLQLIALLWDRGIRKIGYVSEEPDMPNVQKRMAAFFAALSHHGLARNDRWILVDKRLQLDKVKNAGMLMEEFLKRTPHRELPEVFVTSNDLIALGVINALQKYGLGVPADVGVTGFDDIEFAKYYTPPLTTIRQDSCLLGNSCLYLLRELLHGRRMGPLNLNCKLIVRDSVDISGND